MNLNSPFAFRKTLSIVSLLAAGTLAPTFVLAGSTNIASEDELRTNLSDETLEYANLVLSADITVETFDSTASAANPISILAKNATLEAGSLTLSAKAYSETEAPLSANLSLFTLSNNSFSLKTITISGTDTKDYSVRTGRAFMLDGAAVLNLLDSGEQVFSNSILVADSTTNYGARGGAILSANILDEITVAASTTKFSGNVVYDKSSASDENTGAFGGAIYTAGLVSVGAETKLEFSENKAVSTANDAAGGAIFISNANLESTGESSSTVYPDSVIDESGTKEYGLQVAGTLNFSKNSATGENASGGAVFVSGGYFDATGTASVSFDSNSVSNNAGASAGSSLAGGALAIGDGGRATFSEETTLTFSGNSLVASAEQTKASGGALAVMDGTFFSAGTLTFSSNTVSAADSVSDATLSGGAAYFYGTTTTITNADGTKTTKNTTDITLAGTVKFSENKVSGKNSSVSGGAIYVSGAKIDGAALAGIEFSKNVAEATSGEEIAASGGAILVAGDSAEISLISDGQICFQENSASVVAATSSGTAQGGAISQSAGTLDFTFSGTPSGMGNDIVFKSNSATAKSSKTATAFGGAIYLSGGTISFLGETEFQANAATCAKVNDSDTAVGEYAFGGAIYQTSSAGEISFKDNVSFSGNSASVDQSVDGGAQGGAIFSTGEISFAGDAFFDDSVASGQVANGGAIFSAGEISFGKYTNFFENRAKGLESAVGGAIYIDSASIVTAQTLSLDTNEAVTEIGSSSGDAGSIAQGGSVYVAGKLVVSYLAASTNFAVSGAGTAQGGVLYVAGGSVSLDSAYFNSSCANTLTGTAQGGALYVAGGSVSLGEAKFYNNDASSSTTEKGTAQGGAIYVLGGSVSFTNADFNGNYVSGSDAVGGAIYINASKAANLVFSGNTTFSKNTSTVDNGYTKLSDGIAIGSGTGTISLEFSTADGETANISDKISVADGATLSLEKTGAGSAEFGEISASDTSKISLAFDAGTTTLGGKISGTNTDITVAADATVSLGAELAGYTSATIAGTFNVVENGIFTISESATTTVSGTLAFEEASTAKISGAATISGDGTVSVNGNSTFDFTSAGSSLTTGTLSVGAGKLSLKADSGAATLSVTDSLVFTDAGTSEIEIGANATLALTKVERTADGANVTISGTGTLAGTSSDAYVDFSACYATDADGNLTETPLTGTVSVASDVKISTGISVGEGVTLSLHKDSQASGVKKITLAGGTLLAQGSTSGACFGLESFSVEEGGTSKLGSGEARDFQHFEMVASSDGATVEAAQVSGSLEISDCTNFYGDIVLSSGSTLSGKGTVVGTVSGSGTISLANIDQGTISVENGKQITIAGDEVEAQIITIGNEELYANARLVVSANAVEITKLSNYGGRITISGSSDFCPQSSTRGNFYNGGTIVVGENSTLNVGTNFKNYIELSDGTVREGTIDLSATNSAFVFAAWLNPNGTPEIDLSRGKILIDATKLSANSYLQIEGLTDATKTVNIVDTAGYDMTNRFAWDDVSQHWVFLGLNGEAFRGSIFGDWQRESVNRTHEVLRTALFRGNAQTLTPEIYGANKKDSPYMRGYLDKQSRRGNAVASENEARNNGDAALAEKLNSPLKNVWAQADYATRERRSDGDFVAYDSTIASILAGFSSAVGKNWELGATIFAATEKYETSNAGTPHEISTDSYGIAGYSRYKNEWFDWTAGATGAFDSSDSDRGEYSGSFDGSRWGAMTELGATLRVRSFLALRAFAGISLAYSMSDAFDEHGSGGNNALSVDSTDAFGVRTNLGISSAFMLTDTLQFGVRLAWLLDLGKDSYSFDAYMPGTQTEYVINSRDNSTSALDAGAYFNWVVTDEIEVFGGYTGTLRSGETAHGFTLGVNYFF